MNRNGPGIPLLLRVLFFCLLSHRGASAEELLTFTSVHEPVEKVEAGRPLILRIRIPEAGQAAYAVAHYRPLAAERGAPESQPARFRILQLDSRPEDPTQFEGSLSPRQIGPSGIEYYLSVVDLKGEMHILFASAGLPQRVLVTNPEKAPAAALEAPSPTAEPRKGTLTKLREEFELMEAEDPGSVVVTAARRAQRIEKSPSAVSVLTAEQIRQTGAATLTDALRLVPGVHVIQLNATLPHVSIRGFNGQNPNKILTLIDGRSVFTDVFGMTFWEALPFTVSDVQRIEIVRGPVSALYGANAFNGVVNIITKTPEQSKNVEFVTRQG